MMANSSNRLFIINANNLLRSLVDSQTSISHSTRLLAIAHDLSLHLEERESVDDSAYVALRRIISASQHLSIDAFRSLDDLEFYARYPLSK